METLRLFFHHKSPKLLLKIMIILMLFQAVIMYRNPTFLLNDRECPCGIGNITGPFGMMIEGTPVRSAHKYPWSVVLYVDKVAMCGGALITLSHVLTAGHCLVKAGNVKHLGGTRCKTNKDSVENCFLNPSELQLSLMHKEKAVPDRMYDVAQYHINPHFIPLTTFHDLAILTLKVSVSCTISSKPICLSSDPTREKVEGRTAILAAWGPANPGGGEFEISPDILEECTIRFWNPRRCAPYNPNRVVYTICGNCIKGTPCFGDSGSPVFHKRGNRHIAVGVTSFRPDKGCKLELPTFFSHISTYNKWIKRVVMGRNRSSADRKNKL